uniref:Leucine-rich repeat-containing N-terminal plant-type domain-containing protein n=1 Tax=Kalanchoe fedtschenkoi TaxID=63787 RepID=A0A7N0T5M9_KALFE
MRRVSPTDLPCKLSNSFIIIYSKYLLLPIKKSLSIILFTAASFKVNASITMSIIIQLKVSHVRHVTLLLSLLAFFSLCRSSTDLDYLNPAMTQVGCIEREREALMQIKSAFTDDPRGKLSSWTGRDCCTNWAGVTCSNMTGHVEELDLSGASLSGDLSSSITDLKYLTYLNLAYIDFQNKPIPEFIGLMERLTYLDLSCSLFGGVIPPQLGNLSNLIGLYLDYSSNCSSAYHGSELNWVSSLSSLQHLAIRKVNLSQTSEQWLHSINMLSNLISLDISDCGLAQLPQTLPFFNLTSLTHIDLSGNKFSSSMPTWLSNASSLEVIHISFSGLVGRIPGIAFQNMCSLRIIDLEQNSLKSGLVELIDTLANCSNSSMRVLHLQGNRLEEYLPESLGRLRNLNNIDLSFNFLFGSIPTSIGTLANLESINLYDNLMNGTIPESLGQLEGLHYLDIGGSHWQGFIRDAHLSNLENLTHLSLSCSNQSLIFGISTGWNPSFNLFKLCIWDCKLGPSFPAWVASQTNLQVLSSHKHNSFWHSPWLDFSENQLQGNLLAVLTLKKLSYGLMNLGDNLFDGRLPRLRNISELSLKNNKLSGVMSSDLLGQVPLLSRIDLSGNMLVGNIPKKWNGMDGLRYIDFSGNNLSGEVPEELCLLPSLAWLQLSNNNLSGEPCTSVIEFTSLSSIDLGENGFTGNVPKWRANYLQEMRLHGNLFKGSLPPELCSLSYLHVLDISHNKLSGSIPPCLGKMIGFRESRKLSLSKLRYQIRIQSFKMELIMKGNLLIFETNLPILNFIDLSGNELSGNIPEHITDLSNLNGLNLSDNQISGHIPENIGLLVNLESLDLSNNALEGHIPASLASITSLSHLNLSHNNLSGPIPTKNQFQTFNDPSIYEGNPGLCGAPLLKKCDAHNPDQDHANNSDVSEKMMLYTSIVLGFIFGFWGVCGTLALKKSWRDAYFCFVGI